MKRQGFFPVTLGALVLGGLLTGGCVSMGDPSTFAQSAGVIDLSGTSPNWDKALPAAQRFVLLAAFNNDAVRDNNTGLVWEESPQSAPATWNGARFMCINKNVGGQKGWPLRARPSYRATRFSISSRPGIGRRRRVPKMPPTPGSYTSAEAS